MDSDFRADEIQIFRYKFTEEFMQQIFEFSKIHQYDDRETFKEAWTDWLDENADVVSIETERLVNAGYLKDVSNKMFKSARYYFRKKPNVKNVPKERTSYIKIDGAMAANIEEHVRMNVREKPSAAYLNFCESYSILEDDPKIKKAYKNKHCIEKGK